MIILASTLSLLLYAVDKVASHGRKWGENK